MVRDFELNKSKKTTRNFFSGTSRETDLLTLIGSMGIVASLAAIPVAEDIIRDERRRELQRLEDERLRRLRESGYRYGDLDLQLIKR